MISCSSNASGPTASCWKPTVSVSGLASCRQPLASPGAIASAPASTALADETGCAPAEVEGWPPSASSALEKPAAGPGEPRHLGSSCEPAPAYASEPMAETSCASFCVRSDASEGAKAASTPSSGSVMSDAEQGEPEACGPQAEAWAAWWGPRPPPTPGRAPPCRDCGATWPCGEPRCQADDARDRRPCLPMAEAYRCPEPRKTRATRRPTPEAKPPT